MITPCTNTSPLDKVIDMKRILITGGAGFLGSHLCERLLSDGHEVIAMDNFFTGSKANIIHLLKNPYFEIMRHDVVHPFFIEIDEIYHLACPASPIHYQHNPIKTIKTSVMGSINALGLAKRINAKILLASTSEIYGNPDIHPQPESYWGNVNPIGPRACYNEGKRCAETLFTNYHVQHNIDVKIARIFNTYGPRMHPNDGRVVSNFIIQALQNKPISLFGDGQQTRSFCYVDDMITGIIQLMNSPISTPVNLGNPEEISMATLASIILKLTNSNSAITYYPLPEDDPLKRQPDITKAIQDLNWTPTTDITTGLLKTIEYFQAISPLLR